MFLKPPMQTMPMSCACGRQGVSCKVKTAYTFYASFSELCMYFKHTPILYNLIKAHEGLQLSPLTPTQTRLRQEAGSSRPSLVPGLLQIRGKESVYPRWPRTWCHGICHPGLLPPSVVLHLPTPQSLA